MGEHEDLANRLHSAAIHLLRAVSRADAESGLSPARLSALSVIAVRGPLMMTELAGIERVSPATMTSTVSGLEASGLAQRARTGADARQVTVSATTAGRALIRSARRRRLSVLEGYVTRMTPAERASAADVVAALERVTDTTAYTDPE